MKPVELASSVPPDEQSKIDRQKLLMADDKQELFQSFCETIYSEENTSDKQKAGKLQQAWLYCLDLGADTGLNPLKIAKSIKAIITRAKANGVKLKAVDKIKAMLDVNKVLKRKR